MRVAWPLAGKWRNESVWACVWAWAWACHDNVDDGDEEAASLHGAEQMQFVLLHLASKIEYVYAFTVHERISPACSTCPFDAWHQHALASTALVPLQTSFRKSRHVPKRPKEIGERAYLDSIHPYVSELQHNIPYKGVWCRERDLNAYQRRIGRLLPTERHDTQPTLTSAHDVARAQSFKRCCRLKEATICV